MQPIKSSPAGLRNPFKKQQDNAKNVQSPLTLTARTLVDVHETDTLENTDVSDIEYKIITKSVKGYYDT